MSHACRYPPCNREATDQGHPFCWFHWACLPVERHRAYHKARKKLAHGAGHAEAERGLDGVWRLVVEAQRRPPPPPAPAAEEAPAEEAPVEDETQPPEQGEEGT